MTNNLRVQMYPQSPLGNGGITRVIEAYQTHLPKFGIEFVNENPDLIVSHAGMYPTPHILHCHGLYWTAEPDYMANVTEWEDNAALIDAIRYAEVVTVPSKWVARAFERDMHYSPEIIPHGLDQKLLAHPRNSEVQTNGFALWNKTRIGDACSPVDFQWLAGQFPMFEFKTTLALEKTHFTTTTLSGGLSAENLEITGLMPHSEMLDLLAQAKVYVSTARETFGIGVMEALALGVPVLAWNYGHHPALIEHQKTGYLARPGDLEDLANGYMFIQEKHTELSENAFEAAKGFPTWEQVCEQLAEVYRATYAEISRPKKIGVCIPVYNKPELEDALASVQAQTKPPDFVVVVDDGSLPEFQKTLPSLCAKYNAELITQVNAGVAHARNTGLDRLVELGADYLNCLDADDRLAPTYLEITSSALDRFPELTLVYTGLMTIFPDKREMISPWPPDCDFDQQIQGEGHNQVPTCNLFRKKLYTRLGGYRQRYAWKGAGAEDAELWLRAGSRGMKLTRITEEPLFLYSFLTGEVSSKPQVRPPDWTMLHPWTRDLLHPFASYATPTHKSHPADHYDSPEVSVIIPVAAHHLIQVYDALDTLEAQNLRHWEALVIFDFEEGEAQKAVDRLIQAYPFITYAYSKHKGPGRARNLGVSLARAEYIFFLDADDTIIPTTLQLFYEAALREPEQIVYSEDYGISTIPREKLNQVQGEVVEYLEAKQRAIIHYRPGGYDCEKAQRQPELDVNGIPYIWASVSCMMRKSIFEKVGGFDESLPSWEDVDFHWRAAKLGLCYTYLQQPLLNYRYETGSRREEGLAHAPELLEFLRNKYKTLRINMCGCNAPDPSPNNPNFTQAQSMGMPTNGDAYAERILSDPMADNISIARGTPLPGVTYRYQTMNGQIVSVPAEQLVMIRYNARNRGSHPVVGRTTNINYFQHAGGEVFAVHKRDLPASPDIFVPLGKH